MKRELLRAQEEVKRIQAVPLVIGQFLEMIDRNSGIIGSTTGSNYYVRILSTLNRELLKPSSSVALHRHSNALVDILPPEADSSISLLSQSERPDVTYQVCTCNSCIHLLLLTTLFLLVRPSLLYMDCMYAIHPDVNSADTWIIFSNKSLLANPFFMPVLPCNIAYSSLEVFTGPVII